MLICSKQFYIYYDENLLLLDFCCYYQILIENVILQAKKKKKSIKIQKITYIFKIYHQLEIIYKFANWHLPGCALIFIKKSSLYSDFPLVCYLQRPICVQKIIFASQEKEASCSSASHTTLPFLVIKLLMFIIGYSALKMKCLAFSVHSQWYTKLFYHITLWVENCVWCINVIRVIFVIKED